ncbi:Mariner Mos1 transposase [Eumeta japonica]|uniref:Mariner Mos1 transposase n=1 Tax=Eumeta variegata TaxID=151549 RepID=A0A4C1ZK67_EUMVA|nr:Mariner Mos1 transposase [Eumeta japonica]
MCAKDHGQASQADERQASSTNYSETRIHSGQIDAMCMVHRLLVEAYNEIALSERTCRKGFQKFKNGEFDVKDKDRRKRPKIYEDAELKELLEEYSSQIQKELALTLEVTQQAASYRLKSLGMIQKQVLRARGRPIIVEWERDARHSAGLSLVR